MKRCACFWVCAGWFVLVALGVPSLAGAAALEPITGKLDKPGYMVIALAADGAAATAVAPSGSFSVVPPAATVSLSLRAPDGIYAGPIVLDENGTVVKQAAVDVTSARRKVTRAKKIVASAQRNLTAAQRRVRKARDKRAKRTATQRLKLAKRQLTKAKAQLKNANAQLKNANRLLTEAQTQAAGRAKWAVLGVKAGAPLGAIRINTGPGYALSGGLSERVWDMWVNATWTAQATNGVPIAAGNFGRVRSTLLNGAFMGDLDRDGIPDSLDIDKNGNLILNDLDRSTVTAARAAQLQPGTLLDYTFMDEIGNYLWAVAGPFTQPVNANAAGVTDADIDAALVSAGLLHISAYVPSNNATAELDCGGLSYCSAGGTGTKVEIH